MTMSLVSTVTVGAGGAASIEWTGIPQTGTDLLVVLSGRGEAVATTSNLTLNSSTTGYTTRLLFGDGSNVGSSSTSARPAPVIVASSETANTFSNVQVYIPNYAGSTNKSMSIDAVTENNTTNNRMRIYASLWANSSAITSVSFTPSTGNFAQYSTASLYTIEKGSGGASVS